MYFKFDTTQWLYSGLVVTSEKIISKAAELKRSLRLSLSRIVLPWTSTEVVS